MKFELDDLHRNTPDDELLEDLRTVAKKLNKNFVTRFEYDNQGSFHSSTLVRRFVTWYSALERAGLEYTRTPMNIPEEELFYNLEEIWTKLGRQPRYSDVLKPFSKYSVDTYAHRFGTWRKALESFVDFVNNSDENSQIAHNIDKTTEPAVSKHKTTRNINWRLRFVVMKRDNFKCQSCGKSPSTDPTTILHIDHIKAWANGGETILENLQTLCSVCNIGKSDIE